MMEFKMMNLANHAMHGCNVNSP